MTRRGCVLTLLVVAIVAGVAEIRHCWTAHAQPREILFRWCPVVDAARYQLAWHTARPTPGMPWSPPTSETIEPATTLTLPAVRFSDGMRYYFAIRAMNSAGLYGGWSNDVCISFGGPPCPEYPPVPDTCDDVPPGTLPAPTIRIQRPVP